MKKLFTLLLLAVLCAPAYFAQMVTNIDVEVEDLSFLGEYTDGLGVSQNFVGFSSYRVYAVMETEDDRLTSINGLIESQGTLDAADDEPHVLSITTTTGFFNHSSGALLGSGIPDPNGPQAIFYTLAPAIAYDTWLTIGVEHAGQPGADALSSISIPSGVFSPISTVNGGAGAVGLDNAAVFITPDQIAAAPDASGRVLLGQFVTDGDFAFEINLSGIDGGIGGVDTRILSRNVVPTAVEGRVEVCGCDMPGGQGTIFPQPDNCSEINISCEAPAVPGCATEGACNFDELATEDDGSCVFPGDECQIIDGPTGILDENCDCVEEDTTPENDTCDNATMIMIDGPAASGDTSDATETGGSAEDASDCWAGTSVSGDVWFVFTGAGTLVDIETFCGTLTDPQIKIFDGCEGTELDCDDDGAVAPNCGLGSKIEGFCAEDGVDYIIEVEGYNASAGDFTISVITSVVAPALYCSDDTAVNFNPAPGACDVEDNTTCSFAGCTDETACNFDENAQVDDESCEFESCAGCTDENALNFDETATLDDGSCVIPTCEEAPTNFTYCYDSNESTTFSYNAAAGDQVSLVFNAGTVEPQFGGTTWDDLLIYDGTDATGTVLFNSDVDGSDLTGRAFQSTTGSLFLTLDSDGSNSCAQGQQDAWDYDVYCIAEIPGCIDETACNFSEEATEDDGSCEFESCAGCTDETACNFDEEATIDNESCEFESCAGCQDETALNFDAEATIEDNTQCLFPTCEDAPITETYCYDNNLDNAIVAVYNATAGNQVSIVFNAGSLETCCDDVFIYDGSDATGAVLYDSNVDGHDLTGVVVQSTTGSIAIAVDSDGSVSCASGSTSGVEFNYDVYCATAEVLGCTDETACNFDENADTDDGSCEFESCAGCTDAEACNFDEDATIDDGLCCFDNCVNIDGTDSFGDGWNGAELTISDAVSGEVVSTFAVLSVGDGGEGSTGSGFACLVDGCYIVNITDGGFPSEIGATITVDGVVVFEELADNGIENSGAVFTIGEGACPEGCTDDTACNYDEGAVIDDGSCEFESCAGTAGSIEPYNVGLGLTEAGYTPCDQIKADWIPEYTSSQIDGWNWEFTPVGGGDVLTYTSPNFFTTMSLSDLSGPIMYNTDYSVLVAPIVDGVAVAFDPAQAAIITTAPEPTTTVQAQFCGGTYSLTDFIKANYSCNAEGFTFSFTNTNGEEEAIILNSTSSFAYLSMAGLSYGQTYEVAVAVVEGGTEYAFSTESCEITIEGLPTTEMQAQFNSTNAGELAPGTVIKANYVVGATNYTWKFERTDQPEATLYYHPGGNVTVVPINSLALTAGGTYNVSVRAEFGSCTANCSPNVGNDEPVFDVANVYGAIEEIQIEGISVGAAEGGDVVLVENRNFTDIDVAIYPNPNNGEFFNLNITDLENVEVIQLEIFDMMGKVVQRENVAVNNGRINDIIELNGGLTSGMYTVNITVDGVVTSERLSIQR